MFRVGNLVRVEGRPAAVTGNENGIKPAISSRLENAIPVHSAETRRSGRQPLVFLVKDREGVVSRMIRKPENLPEQASLSLRVDNEGGWPKAPESFLLLLVKA